MYLFNIVIFYIIFLTRLSFGYFNNEKLLSRKTRIIGGDHSEIEYYPFMVAILRYTGLNCGGTIVSTKWILTAAHCAWNKRKNMYYSARELAVVAGCTSWILRDDCPTRQSSLVRSVRCRNFTFKPTKDDIALLELLEDLTFTDPSVRSVTLATESWFYENILGCLEETCVALGWGLDESGQKSKKLKTVKLSVLPNVFCSFIISLQNFDDQIDDTNLCTYSFLKEGFCRGDSGGPLLCRNTQIGIVSGNFGCDNRFMPSIWTKVDSFQKWINETMNIANKAIISCVLYVLILYNILINFNVHL